METLRRCRIGSWTSRSGCSSGSRFMGLESRYVAILAAAALTAVPLVLLAEGFGKRLGLIDKPRPGETQRHVVPRTGGYGLFVAFWLAVGASFLVAPADLERLPADNLRLV